jgi:carboxylate-amine ligase
VRTVGVEEELLLVDIHDGRPRSVSGRVLLRAAQDLDPVDPARDPSDPGADVAASMPSEVVGSIDAEFQREQLETRTAPVADLAALEAEIRHWRSRAIALARGAGSNIAALAMSPLPVRPRAFPKPRYLHLYERFGITARQHLTCGLHVHVSVTSDEEGVGVLDRIRVWLPALLALSANSPFVEGQDSGYASFRSQAQGRWPTNGPAEVFGSAAEYHRLVDDMVGSGVIDRGLVYFDARLSHHYPTVEIRTPDVCLEVVDTVLLAALGRGLVDTAADAWARGEPPPSVPASLLRLASWKAGREGLEGELLDPCTHRPTPAKDVAGALLQHVEPALRRNGDWALAEGGVERLLTSGTGATRQRRTYARTGRLLDVVAQAVRVTAGHE